MKKSEIVTCFIIASLGLFAAILGFVSEAKHIRAKDVEKTADGRCVYPSSPALSLGVIAAFALLMAQVIVNVAAGCLCCAPAGPVSTKSNRSIAIISLVVSWVTFVLAFLLLFAGALLNGQRTTEIRDTDFDYECYVVKNGVFAGGAVLGMATVTLGIIYYITAASVKSATTWGTQNQNIAMAQPSQVQANAPPIFVPENAYEPNGYPQHPPTAQRPPWS